MATKSSSLGRSSVEKGLSPRKGFRFRSPFGLARACVARPEFTVTVSFPESEEDGSSPRGISRVNAGILKRLGLRTGGIVVECGGRRQRSVRTPLAVVDSNGQCHWIEETPNRVAESVSHEISSASSIPHSRGATYQVCFVGRGGRCRVGRAMVVVGGQGGSMDKRPIAPLTCGHGDRPQLPKFISQGSRIPTTPFATPREPVIEPCRWGYRPWICGERRHAGLVA